MKYICVHMYVFMLEHKIGLVPMHIKMNIFQGPDLFNSKPIKLSLEIHSHSDVVIVNFKVIYPKVVGMSKWRSRTMKKARIVLLQA